jgi:hypothetical protein
MRLLDLCRGIGTGNLDSCPNPLFGDGIIGLREGKIIV